jgi:hypothetical protein
MNIRESIEALEQQIEALERLDSHTLADAITDQLGVEDSEELIQTLKDVNVGGANAGFGGFIYSSELKAFYEKHRDSLIDLLVETSRELDTNILDMIQDFNCIKDQYSTEEIREVLHYGLRIPQIVDAICWFALEDFARLAE